MFTNKMASLGTRSLVVIAVRNSRTPRGVALRTRKLYRRICREIPWVIAVYDMEESVSEIRKAVKKIFVKSSKSGGNPEFMLEKGQLELDETLQQYKQKSHVYQILGLAQSCTTLPCRG